MDLIWIEIQRYVSLHVLQWIQTDKNEKREESKIR